MTHSYGGKPNEALLQFYGFVDTDNPHDVYTADMADWVKTRYGVLEERWQFVETDAAAMQSLQQVGLFITPVSHTWMSHLQYDITCGPHLLTSVLPLHHHVSHPFPHIGLLCRCPVMCCIHEYMHAQDFVPTCMLKGKGHMLAASFMQSLDITFDIRQLLSNSLC